MSSTDPSPSELDALAYAEPPITPRGLAGAIYILSTIFLACSTLVIVLRVYVRGWMLRTSKGWGVDDILAVSGYIPFAFFCIYAILGAHYGLGMLDEDLNKLLIMRATKYMFVCQLTIAISVPFTKASIAVTVMRITSERRYRWIFIAIIVISAGSCLSGVIGLLITCRPLAAKWNPGLGTCSGNEIILLGSYAFSLIAIVSDFACALIPYLIVRNLEMPRRSKITITIILGFGVFASIACVIRIPYFSYYTKTENILFGVGYVILWSSVESAVGIISGSLPSLRKLFGHHFDSKGDSYQRDQRGGARAGAQNTIGGTPFSVIPSRTHHQLEMLSADGKSRGAGSGGNTTFISSSKGRSRGEDWDQLDDDESGGDSSVRGITTHTSIRIDVESLSERESTKSGRSAWKSHV